MLGPAGAGSTDPSDAARVHGLTMDVLRGQPDDDA